MLFMGAMMLFSVRTVMSVCALEISKEFNYDKTQMVSLVERIGSPGIRFVLSSLNLQTGYSALEFFLWLPGYASSRWLFLGSYRR